MLVRCWQSEIDARSPIGVLDLHAIGAGSRSVEGNLAFPVADVGFWKAVFLTHFSTHIFGPVVSDSCMKVSQCQRRSPALSCSPPRYYGKLRTTVDSITNNSHYCARDESSPPQRFHSKASLSASAVCRVCS